MRKRLIIAAVVLLLLAGLVTVCWNVFDWPPPRLILKYGFPPTGGPTGRVREVEEIEFVELKPGYFRMGSHFHCEEGDFLGKTLGWLGVGTPPKHDEDSGECPPRWVEIQEGFWIAKTEVTNAQYERFDPKHGRGPWSKGDDHPVVVVSWEDAKAYCGWLTNRIGVAVRLPSEAEWECACRAGSKTEFAFGDDETQLEMHAWYYRNSHGRLHEVGTKPANAWWLYNMHGNAWEWCEDTYREGHEDAPPDGSAWTGGDEGCVSGPPLRVFRGGSWFFTATDCRSARRYRAESTYCNRIIGFRPVAEFPVDEE